MKIFLMIIFLTFILCTGNKTNLVAKENELKKIYRSPLSDRGWYSKNKQVLEKDFKKYLDQVKTKGLQNVMALILPHAGYVYSGQVTAYAIKEILNTKYSRIIILGPSHGTYMYNHASVPDFTHYKTPLGEVALDVDFIQNLLRFRYFKNNPKAHKQEHSVQIEIPFLQYAFENIKLVPVVVGDIDLKTAQKIGELLLKLIDEKTLVIASSDFTHYGPGFHYVPFKENIPENLKELDLGAFKFIEKKDLQGFKNYCSKTGITICGENPLSILISMLPENAKCHLLKYDTSGNLMKNWKPSVSYISGAFTGTWKRNKKMNEQKQNALSDFDKKTLLKLARETLEYYLLNKQIPVPEDLGITITPPMQEIMGAFVTLHKQGMLRGCIGEIFPSRALYKAVILHAVNSGTKDYRFPNVQKDELNKLVFEISALTAPYPVDSYNDIVLGKHGIVLEKHGRQSVFLPQVAPEQNWDLKTTLKHLSMKAGLPEDAWKEGTSFLVFEAIVFSEE